MRALLAFPFVLFACGGSEDAPHVRVDTSLIFPRAVLDHVTALSISVFEGGVTCDPSTGTSSGSGTELVSKQALATVGCAGGAKFCGDLSIDKSASPRVFQAVGADASGAQIASGCTTATVQDDKANVSIKMMRFVTPAVCSDDILQPTEQCFPGGTDLCDSDCQSNELLLSVGSSANGTSTGVAGDKSAPTLLWSAGTDQAGWLFAFYTDRATGAMNNTDIGMRVMGDDLLPVKAPPAPVAYASASLFLPNGTNSGNLPPAPAAFSQSAAHAAFLGSKIYVAFQDDDSPGSQGLDIHLRAMDARGAADARIGINGDLGAGEALIQAAPAIASSGTKLFVAWEVQPDGKISGRALTPPNTLSPQNDISTGTGNSHVSLAKTASGFVAVWQSGTGIKLRAITADGTPQGAEQNVSEGSGAASAPQVAALDDGRFAIAWTAGGDIVVQRYDAAGVKIAGDQAAPVNDVIRDATQSSATIGGTPAEGGSYVVAWLDESTNHVRGRFLGGSDGFLVNHVTGQSSEFQMSRSDGRVRANPTIAAGGSGPFVAVAWEDKGGGAGTGIVARRFPLPQKE